MAKGVLWLNDLSGGINQRSPDLMGDDQFEMLINVTQAQLGDIAHRLGTERFLDSVDSNDPVRGLGMFKKDDGNRYLHMVCNGTLYVNSGTWSSQAASEWSTTSEISMVNFIGRHYMASSVAEEWLRYFTNTGSSTYVKLFATTASASSTSTTLVASTSVFNSEMVGMKVFNTSDGTSRTITAFTNATTVTVDTAINDTWDGDNIEMRLDGKYLAVNGAYMMIAGNSVYPRRVYYTNVASDTINVETDYFNVSEPPTGLASYGNGRAFVIFTSSDYTVADPASLYTNVVEDFGCVSHRTIQNILGNLIFVDNDAVYLLNPNASYPTDISLVLKNDFSLDAIFNKVNPTNLTSLAAGVIGTRYYLMLRDLSGTVKGETLESCMIEIDITQNNWKAHTFTTNDIGSVFSTFTDSTGTFLYAGSWSTGTVYKMEIPNVYTDDDVNGDPQTVTSIIQTKHYVFVNKGSEAVIQKNVLNLHYEYFAEDPIEVKFSIDGASTYDNSKNLDLPAYNTTRWCWDYFSFGEECKSLSQRISCPDKFVIYAFGMEIEGKEDTALKGS